MEARSCKFSRRFPSEDSAIDAVFQDGDIEVNQETNANSCESHIGQQLCFINGTAFLFCGTGKFRCIRSTFKNLSVSASQWLARSLPSGFKNIFE